MGMNPLILTHPKILRLLTKLQLFRQFSNLADLLEEIQRITEKKALLSFKIEIEQENFGNFPFVTFYDEFYPPLLREIYDPPLILFYKGNPEILLTRTYSVVGTRKPSPISCLATKFLVQEWKYECQSICSGMALGIDRMAFLAAEEEGLSMIGVLGTSLSQEYPPQNKDLYRLLGKTKNSILISETWRESYSKWTFPKRNRLISGISWKVALMESSEKSGTLWTASSAVSQNREVFVFDHELQNNNKGGRAFLEEGAIPLSWENLLSNKGKILSPNEIAITTDIPIPLGRGYTWLAN